MGVENCDPDALGAFLTDDQNESAAEEPMENMDFTSDDMGGSSKPAYPDFLSMAMAEAELEPDYGGLDEDPFLSGIVDSAELGGIPEQRNLSILVDDEESPLLSGGVGTDQDEDSSTGKPSIMAVQRMISQSSQPLQHGALAAHIPTQKAIHYTAQDHPPLKEEILPDQPGVVITSQHGEEDIQQTTQPAPTQQGIQINAQLPRQQPVRIQQAGAQPGGLQQTEIQQGGLQQTGLQQTGIQQGGLQPTRIQQGGLQQTGIQQGGLQQTGIQHGGLQQTGVQQGGLHKTGIQQSGLQQSGLQQTGIRQGGLQQTGIQQGGLQQTGIQQGGLQQTGLQQTGIRQRGLQQTGIQHSGLQQTGIQQGGLQQVIIGQGTGNLQQLVLGSSQVISANVLSGQANFLPQSLVHLGRHQLRPKMGVVLKQPGGGGMVYDAANKGLKQVLVLNPQTGVLSQIPGNIQLTGQLTIPQQSTAVMGSPQVIIQNTQQQPGQTKCKTTSIMATSASGIQPVITVAASDGNIIVLRNSTPLFTTPGTSAAAVQKSAGSVTKSTSSSQIVSHSTASKPAKSKQSKGKGKSRRGQQKSTGSKPAVTLTVASTANSSTSNTSHTHSVQSLGTIPSIQTSSPLPRPEMTSSAPTTSFVNTSTAVSTHNGNAKSGLFFDKVAPSLTKNTTEHASEPTPVISHQAGTVHYRPRQAVPRNQGDRNPALQQLVQNLRAQGDNERLRSLRELQKLLQQNPQASQQLQELMKSKLGGTEVSMKKPLSTLSSNVTKPPNVYLTPQQSVASVLPFQTTGSKLFPGSISSTGSTAGPGGLAGPRNLQDTTPSSLQTLSGILSSVATQASDTKPPATNVKFMGTDKTGMASNSPSINLDFLEKKPSPSQLKNPNYSTAEACSSSVPFTSLSNNPSNPTSQQVGLSNSSEFTQVDHSSPQQLAVPNTTGLFSSLSSNSSPAMDQFSTTGPSVTMSSSLNLGLLQSSSVEGGGQSTTPPSPVDATPLNTSVTQGHPTAIVGAKTGAIHDSMLSRVGAPSPSSGPQTHPQTSQTGGRPTITMTAEQLGIRAQLQLQQIQAMVHQLLQKPSRSDQENRQLQQLLLYRNKMIAKVKAHLAQLNHPQRLAALSMVQQIRARAQNAGTGPVHSPTAPAKEAVVPSSLPVVPTSSATQTIKAGGAFASLPVPPQNTCDSLGATNVQSPQLSLNQISPTTPLASPPGSSRQIQNARITSTTSKQDVSRGEKQKAGGQGDRNTASKKMKVTTDPPPLLPLSSGAAGGAGPGLLRAKLQEESFLSNTLSATQATTQGQDTTPITKEQMKSQQYQHTMKMLEEKLRSMTPAQQREFLLQYQPLLHKFTQAGQKILANKKLDSAGSILNSVNKATVSSQRLPTQGNSSKDCSSGKQPSSKSSTPTLLQLITEGNRTEPKPKKHEKKAKPPLSKAEMLAKQLKKERNLVTRTEMKKGFKSRSDAVSKLLSFHICQDTSPTEKYLQKFGQDYEEHSTQLLQRKSEMVDKYRHLLLKESMRRGPSAEMVMLDRMVLQDEKLNFEYEKQLAKNPETQNRLLAIIKPNQSKKERFLHAAVAYQTSTAPTVITKQDSCLPPKKRVHIETKSEAELKPKAEPKSEVEPGPELEPKPKVEPELPRSPETPIKEPQITKNDFRTKITIKIPKSSYRPPSSSPSSEGTMHSSSLSSPDLLSPRSDAGSDTPVVRCENPHSPRVRLRRHSTLQALLMSDSPLEVNIDELKGSKRTAIRPLPVYAPASNATRPPPFHAQHFIPSSSPPPLIPSSPRLSLLLQTHNHKQYSSQSNTTDRDAVKASKDKVTGRGRATGTTGKGNTAINSDKGKAILKVEKGRVRAAPKEAMTNGKTGHHVGPLEQDMSVFDFDEKLRVAPNNPFEPMDVLQDSLQDEMNSTINSILGLQRPSPEDGDHGGLMTSSRGALPSAIFESCSNYDDEFYDDVEAMDECSYGDVGGTGEATSGDAMAGLRSELDIMMEEDEEDNDT